jgi:hypothetical protein
MKKIISIITIALLPVCWQGCEEVLDKIPDSSITLEKMLSDRGASTNLITTVYNEMNMARDRQSYFFLSLEVFTDNAYRHGIDLSAYGWHRGDLSLENAILSWDEQNGRHWPNYWRGIRMANNAIKYLPLSTVVTAQERDRWVAEARVLRCWFYMQLLEYYGPMPWIDFPFEATYTGWNDLTRPTYDEIVSIISNELLDVIGSGVLPNRQPYTDFRRPSNGLAYAIRARLLLNNASPLNNPENDPAKWQRAADAAQDVINLPEYALVNMSDYKSLFIGQDPAEEVIWRSWENNGHINNTCGVNVGAYPFATITRIWGAGESPSQELVDCFEMTNGALPVTYNNDAHTNVTITSGATAVGYSEAPGGDPYANRDARFYIDIVYNGVNYGEPYNCDGLGDYIIETFVGGRNGFNESETLDGDRSRTGYYTRKEMQIKYWSTGQLGSGVCEPTHWVYFRLAEFYLNKAEALCELNDLNGARTALNIIRNRAGQPNIENVPGYQNTQDFLRQRIRNERRVELCMEGGRFHDQRRWKILNETNRVVTGMRITKADNGQYSYERVKIADRYSYTDKYLVLPIPLNDARKMTGMTQPPAWQ